MEGQYATRRAPMFGGSFVVQDRAGRVVDVYRTRSGAEYARRLLNTGLARVQPHALVGCRVEVMR